MCDKPLDPYAPKFTLETSIQSQYIRKHSPQGKPLSVKDYQIIVQLPVERIYISNTSVPTCYVETSTYPKFDCKRVTLEHSMTSRSEISDLTKFMLKKDLLLSKLNQFDDRPERYHSWKQFLVCGKRTTCHNCRIIGSLKQVVGYIIRKTSSKSYDCTCT